MTPATVRPEKDGKGYEIIAGHRRHHGGTRAGLEEMPCIVREMTDLEAVREMRNSNKQRGDPLPSELAKLLDLEVEAIKRQGARPKNEKEAEALGKLSVEIVGKEHDMNYKKVMRYIRLNSLVPELHAVYPAQFPGAGASGQGGRKADGLHACGGDFIYPPGKPAADCRFH